MTRHATACSAPLFYIDTHASSCSRYNIAGRIEIIGIQVHHFLFGYLLDLRPGNRTDPIAFGIAGTLGDLGLRQLRWQVPG